jgi:hypothetical protein
MQRRLLLPVSSGIAGVALAHGLAYALAFPRAAERVAAHPGGHGYWHHAGEFGLLAALLAVLLAAGRGLAPDRSGRAGFSSSLAQTVGWQISLFTCLEVAERLAAGGSVLSLPAEPVFWIGVAVQAVTAAVALALLTGIEEIVAAVVRPRRPRQRRPGCSGARPTAVLAPRPTPTTRAAPRGPPCLAR